MIIMTIDQGRKMGAIVRKSKSQEYNGDLIMAGLFIIVLLLIAGLRLVTCGMDEWKLNNLPPALVGARGYEDNQGGSPDIRGIK